MDSPEQKGISRQARGEPIKKVSLKDGSVRYRVVVDAGKRENGERCQVTRTFKTKKEATSWLVQTRNEVTGNAYVRKTKLTVKEFLDSWIDGREKIRSNTREGYRSDLKPVTDKYGHLPLQDLTSQMLIALKQEMRTTGGRKGQGRSPRTVQLMLTLLGSALEAAKEANLVKTNVASSKLVERPQGSDFQGESWTVAQVAAFLEYTRADRYEAAWRISLCGLRRSEVLALTWADVDLESGTLTVNKGRTVRKGKGVSSRSTVDGPPKRPRSYRTLPLPLEVTASLRRLRRRQQEERLKLGQTLDPSDLIVSDELGQPIHPDTYSSWFRRVTKAAGLPQIRLHDARRTAATLLATEYNVPDDAAASYLGHDPVTYHRVYVIGEKGYEVVRDALSQAHTGTDGRNGL